MRRAIPVEKRVSPARFVAACNRKFIHDLCLELEDALS